MDGITFSWPGSGFGNALIVAHVVSIVRDNGINAVFEEHETCKGLVDVPLFNADEHSSFHKHRIKTPNTFFKKYIDESVITTYVKDVSNLVGRKLNINPKLNYVPIIFKEVENIPEVDVTLCTKSGPWGVYRDWSYFEDLKEMFDKNGISYIDLHANSIFSNDCLNYVKKCKLYVGLETGMSHYVSKFANGKALIIQSGFCMKYFWAGHYDYDYIIAEGCEYRPCFINKNDIARGLVCPKDNLCMRNLTAEMVFDEVIKKL